MTKLERMSEKWVNQIPRYISYRAGHEYFVNENIKTYGHLVDYYNIQPDFRAFLISVTRKEHLGFPVAKDVPIMRTAHISMPLDCTSFGAGDTD